MKYYHDDWPSEVAAGPYAVEPANGELSDLTLVISALDGPSVTVDEVQFRRLAARAGVDGPDITSAELGQLITAAKASGPAPLLTALLFVRSSCPIYRLRHAGRPWKAVPATRN